MNPKKILITGRGQLGSFYADYFRSKNAEVKSFGSELDIRKIEDLEENIKNFQPDLVINAAAKTNIDWCEQNKTECFSINTLGADNIGEVCAKRNIYLAHISSGCLLESKSAEDAQDELSEPSPLCFYSWTKIWAEEILNDRAKKEGLKVLILRPRQLLSSKADARNALTKLLTYEEFIDEPNSCTVVEDLLRVTEELIHKDAVGVFNVVNPGVSSPWQIAQMLKEIIKPEMKIKKISNEELRAKTLAKRVNAVLSIAKLEGLGIKLNDIHERMRETIINLKKNLESPNGLEMLNKTKKETAEKLGLVKLKK